MLRRECSKPIVCMDVLDSYSRIVLILCKGLHKSRNRKLALADGPGGRLARIGVEKSSSHHLSHNEIAGDNERNVLDEANLVRDVLNSYSVLMRWKILRGTR